MGSQRKEKGVVDLIKVVKKIVGPQRGKKIDVGQRDKSYVGPQRKEKHIFDLIKMVKKICGSTKRSKNERRKKSLFLCCTNFFFEADNFFFLHKTHFLGSIKHNAQQIPPTTK